MITNKNWDAKEGKHIHHRRYYSASATRTASAQNKYITLSKYLTTVTGKEACAGSFWDLRAWPSIIVGFNRSNHLATEHPEWELFWSDTPHDWQSPRNFCKKMLLTIKFCSWLLTNAFTLLNKGVYVTDSQVTCPVKQSVHYSSMKRITKSAV
jgi:hypothetical protein